MGHKVFVSYKYSDYKSNKVKYRDLLMDELKSEGSIYRGEDGYSDDLTDKKAETIKNRLKPIIHDSTVTIVLISPNICQSKWVDWEIHYSLMDVTREKEGRSRMSGLIGVLLPTEDQKYDYYRVKNECGSILYKDGVIPQMIKDNRYNLINQENVGITKCGKTYDKDYGSYASLYTWDEFMKEFNQKIELAYKKSRELRQDYKINVIEE